VARDASRNKAPAPTATAAAATAPSAGADAIRVRMYRVGFGDCFLLSLPTATGLQHVLVDCGVHCRGDIKTIERVVKDIAQVTGGRVALVIATHPHQDHISGFGDYADTFRALQVVEVWLPWTEDPTDPDAVKLQQQRRALAAQLAQHFAAKPADSAERLAATAALENLRGNDAALHVLDTGINGAHVRYVALGQQLTDVAAISGLRARILGPPRDPKFLAQMTLPRDQRLFRGAAGAAAVVGADAPADDAIDAEMEGFVAVEPFEQKWVVGTESNRYYAAITERDKNLLAVAATSADLLAFALDDVVNNTSVVVLFSYRGKNLLFAGDARYGNWAGWIEPADTSRLLRDVHFYKVAHHGSPNATPRSALEGLPRGGFAAMVSTQSVPWDTIPLPKLMDQLAARSNGLARSDSIAIDGAPAGPALAGLPAEFVAGEFWIDYFLPL
jgi:beta-lactamase superfamily II metal-dependent hydrolase